MKTIGLTRIRNESEIIEDTIRHMLTFCDKIVVYDDCSTDNTTDLVLNFDTKKEIFLMAGLEWDTDRKRAEWQNRSDLLKMAKKIADPEDWFVYMDADERIDFDFTVLKYLQKDIVGIRMKLFDYYITPEDINEHYTKRHYIGPEYRNILMAFRNLDSLDFSSPDQREVHLRNPGRVIEEGSVKHYGKAVSVAQFEETCDYYINHFPKYSAKWKKRRGRSVHIKSDFGAELILWCQRNELGYPLTPEIQNRENTRN